MLSVILGCLLLSISVFAEVGKVLSLNGPDAVILRAEGKQLAQIDAPLEEGDEIDSQNSLIVLYLYPSTQISLSKNSKIRITKALLKELEEGEENQSIIHFIKGLIRLKITKENDQKIEQDVVADGVSFSVRGTDFEVALDGDDVDLDVYEGEVEVTSPNVHTFVPERVKANEGFRYGRKNQEFSRRKFKPKFRDQPGFVKREQLREKWKSLRAEKKLKRSEMKANRQEKISMNKERREQKKNASRKRQTR